MPGCVLIKFGGFLLDRRQIFVGRFYWQTKVATTLSIV